MAEARTGSRDAGRVLEPEDLATLLVGDVTATKPMRAGVIYALERIFSCVEGQIARPALREHDA